MWVWVAWMVGRTRRRARGRAVVRGSRSGERAGGGVRRGESRVGRPVPRGRTRWGRGRAARATQARGGGNGTGSVRDGGTLASITGQSAEGEKKTGLVAEWRARTSFSPDVRSVEAGSCSRAVSLAAATLTHRWQARAGSKVAWSAVITRMVCRFSENILPHAKTCTASSSAPLAQSQAKRRQAMENFLRKGGRRGN